MDPLLLVIITFGLIFVVTASLGQGLGITGKSFAGPLRDHRQLNVMMLISTFILMPAVLIGLASLLPFTNQVKMAVVVLAICGGAPFVPWLVGLAKGNLGYSVAATDLLLLATFIILPLAVPPLVRALDTGADVSAWKVAWPMLLFMLLPLVIGILIRARSLSLTMALASWLGPVSLTFLMAHIVLSISYSWKDFVSIAGYGQMAFALAFPIFGLLVGGLLSPPYVLSPVPATDPHRGSKIVSMVAVAQQNTGAVICCAIFAFGRYTVAGDYMLLGAIVTIVVVMLFMAELGARFEKKQSLAPGAPKAGLLVATQTPEAPSDASPPAATAAPEVRTTPSQGPPQAAQDDH